MKARTLGSLLAVAALVALFLALRDRGPSGAPAPPPPEPAGTSRGPAPAAAPSAIDARLFRSRDEVILLARLAADGRPAAGAAVLLLDEAGGICGRGTTDPRGVFRGRFEGEPKTVSIQARDESPLALPLPAAPPAAAPRRPLLASRSVLRPGDRFRVCAWNRDVADRFLETSLRFEPEPEGEPGILDPGDTWKVSSGFDSSLPRWETFEGRVPADAHPGRAFVSVGGETLEIPIVPRFGPALPAPPAAATAAAPGDPSLRRDDGAWRVDLGGPAEGTPVLVFASSGDRLLGHGAALAEGTEVLVPLPEERIAQELAVTAIVALPDGFREHHAVVTPPGPALRIEPLTTDRGGGPGFRVALAAGEDLTSPILDVPVPVAAAVDDPAGGSFEPVLVCQPHIARLEFFQHAPPGGQLAIRALAIPPGGAPIRAEASLLPADDAEPALSLDWIREGDAPSVEHSLPAVPDAVPVRFFLPEGVPSRFPDSFAGAPLDCTFWRPVGCTGAGALRLHSGDAIVLETTVEGLPPEEEPEGGALSDLDGPLTGPLVVSCDAPGFRGIVFLADVERDGATASGGSTPDFSLSRTLPERGSLGDEFEASLSLRAERSLEGSIEVVLPLPRGATPAEDGWSIRARGPERCRVTALEEEVRWTLPRLAAGETRLSVRVRLVHRGRWVAPPAKAWSADLPGFAIHTAGGVLQID